MDEERQYERADLLSRLFALITMKMKDSAGIAADCQGQRPIEELRQGAEKLNVLLSQTSTVLAAAASLLQGDE